jgi:hypothetical protein
MLRRLPSTAMSLCRSPSAASDFLATPQTFSPSRCSCRCQRRLGARAILQCSTPARRPLGHSLRPGPPLRLRRLLLLPLCKAQYFACLLAIASDASPEVLTEAIQKSQRAVCFLHHARRPEFEFAPFYASAYVCNPPMLAAHRCRAELAAAYVYNTSMPTANRVVPCFPPFFTPFVYIMSTILSIYCPFGPSTWPMFPPIGMPAVVDNSEDSSPTVRGVIMPLSKKMPVAATPDARRRSTEDPPAVPETQCVCATPSISKFSPRYLA